MAAARQAAFGFILALAFATRGPTPAHPPKPA